MFVTAMKTPEMKPKFDQQGLIPVNCAARSSATILHDIIADYQRITTASRHQGDWRTETHDHGLVIAR